MCLSPLSTVRVNCAETFSLHTSERVDPDSSTLLTIMPLETININFLNDFQTMLFPLRNILYACMLVCSKLDNTRRARVAPKGLKLRDTGYALAMFLSHPAMIHPCSNHAIFIHPSRITTSIHDNSNYAAILSPGSPSTKWSSFRTLFWTRGFSIARETYKRLVKNRSADRFRDTRMDGRMDARTD